MSLFDPYRREHPSAGYRLERQIIQGRVVAAKRRRRLRNWVKLRRLVRRYMKPSSRRASSDIMSMPQGGSQVISTST